MSTCLVIARGLLQLVALSFVFVELAVIRGFELKVPTPWAPAAAWMLRRLGRSQVLPATGLASTRRPWGCA